MHKFQEHCSWKNTRIMYNRPRSRPSDGVIGALELTAVKYVTCTNVVRSWGGSYPAPYR